MSQDRTLKQAFTAECSLRLPDVWEFPDELILSGLAKLGEKLHDFLVHIYSFRRRSILPSGHLPCTYSSDPD